MAAFLYGEDVGLAVSAIALMICGMVLVLLPFWVLNAVPGQRLDRLWVSLFVVMIMTPIVATLLIFFLSLIEPEDTSPWF